jgi:ankyrin repeat protein
LAFWAAFRDFDRTARVLTTANAKIERRDGKRKTPMHWAAERGSVKTMRLLLSVLPEIDLEAQDESGWTPLFWAAYQDKVEAMQVLIEQGANKNALDNWRWTPLFWAAYFGHQAVVEYLI